MVINKLVVVFNTPPPLLEKCTHILSCPCKTCLLDPSFEFWTCLSSLLCKTVISLTMCRNNMTLLTLIFFFWDPVLRKRRMAMLQRIEDKRLTNAKLRSTEREKKNFFWAFCMCNMLNWWDLFVFCCDCYYCQCSI